jgi:4-amino-4-deoxy-L-arabinose transferase-like glycosyltransferase
MTLASDIKPVVAEHALPTFSRKRLVVALGLFTLITRAPALAYSGGLDDEGVYAVVATEMLRGGQPYVDAVERKPPLLFYIYEGILKLAGMYNLQALHVAMLAWVCVTLYFIHRILRSLFDDLTGFAGAFLYALFMCWADRRSLALNGELLMNLPIAAAVAITLGPTLSRFRVELLVAGALIGIAFLIKQPAGVTAAPLGLYLLLKPYRQARRITLLQSLLQATLFSLGFAAVLTAMAAFLVHEGIFREALYWTIQNHNIEFGITTWIYWFRLPKSLALFVLECLPLLILCYVSLNQARRSDGIWRERAAEFWALLLLVMASVLGISANGQWLLHYFLQLTLPLSLVAAPVLARIWTGTLTCSQTLLQRGPLKVWLGFLALLFLVVNTIGVITEKPREAGRYVREHSNPEDRMFVWGQGVHQTGQYLEAERRPASRYIASFPLTGHIFGIWDPSLDTTYRILPGSWQNLQREFELHPPRFIIDSHVLHPPPRLYLMTQYPYLRDLVAQHYRKVHSAPDGVIYERL